MQSPCSDNRQNDNATYFAIGRKLMCRIGSEENAARSGGAVASPAGARGPSLQEAERLAHHIANLDLSNDVATPLPHFIKFYLFDMLIFSLFWDRNGRVNRNKQGL